MLDTNVLLHDPSSLFAFEDNNVIIPIYVIEEIDTFKKDSSQLGKNARMVARFLDELRLEGSLSEGVTLSTGGTLKIVFTASKQFNELFIRDNVDSKILAVAYDLHQTFPDIPTILVTKDTNLRIRADTLGIPSENYDEQPVDVSALYSGTTDIKVKGEDIDLFFKNGYLELKDLYYFPNEMVVLIDELKPSHTALGKIDLHQGRIVPIAKYKNVWGIVARNKEQMFGLDLLMNDKLSLVTLVGKAGTGKTLLAIAAGLQKVIEEKAYSKLLVSRPIYALGKDIGYLPGDIEEKLNPWMKPIYDNVEYLMGINPNERDKKRGHLELIDMGFMEIEPLTYIRGRSIPKQLIIIDEAQNLTPHEIKTIVTRAGEGTKFIITGDPYQIDNPYLDATNNGLVHVVNRFRNEKIAGHITLTKGERSELAELAANVL